MERRILRLRITGLVQGVGYRAFVDGQARRLGLEGWVRNRSDSSVEAVIAGAARARGPHGAQMEDVDLAAAEPSALAAGRCRQFCMLSTQ